MIVPASPSPQIAEPTSKPVPRESGIESWIFWILALAVLAAAGIHYGRIWWKRRKRARIEQETIDPTLEARFRKALKKLFSSEIPSRDQVIQAYSVFLELMEEVDLPKAEYLPPTHYDLLVRRKYPDIGNQSFHITQLFCDCFYGEKDPSPEELAPYRESILGVIDHFSP